MSTVAIAKEALLTLNERAQRLADHMAANAASLRITVQQTAGARILDCGVHTPGGLQAGLGLARVCLAAQADVTLSPGDVAGIPSVQVAIATDHPVTACMAAQYAGWQISVGKFFAMGSGPMRAVYGKEPLYDDIGYREKSPHAVGVLETGTLPTEDVVQFLAGKLGLAPEKLTLLA